jgi:hypothetical protein
MGAISAQSMALRLLPSVPHHLFVGAGSPTVWRWMAWALQGREKDRLSL